MRLFKSLSVLFWLKASLLIGVLLEGVVILISTRESTSSSSSTSTLSASINNNNDNEKNAQLPIIIVPSAVRTVSTQQAKQKPQVNASTPTTIPATTTAKTTHNRFEEYRFPPPRLPGIDYSSPVVGPSTNKLSLNHLFKHPELSNQTFIAVNDTQLHYSQIPYCLRGPMYGLANNRVLSLARMLHRGVKEQRPIGLSKPISDWYRMFFEEHPMFWLDYYHEDDTATTTTPCYKTNRPEQAYRLNEKAACIPELVTELIPKASVRNMAEQILREHIQNNDNSPAATNDNNKFIAIHRRNFEGACMRRSGRHHVAADYCPRDEGRKHCVLNYTTVEQYYNNNHHLHAGGINNNNNTDSDSHANIWLFTDGQEPILDATFPKIFNATRDYGIDDDATALFLDMWLMTLADEHWGHTESTVDVVVWHWRKYQQTFPQNCFVPNPECSVNVKTQ